MPALQPPSMQIGVLPPGYMALPSAGPTPLQAGFSTDVPFFVQQVANATTVVTPASLTVTLSSTLVASTLLMTVAVAATGTAPVVTPPAGWRVVTGSGGSNGANTLRVASYVLPAANNPGSITTVVINVTNANGIAAWISEWSGNWMPPPYPVIGNAATYNAGVLTGGQSGLSNSSAAVSAGSTNPQVGPVMMFGCEADVTGQAYTAANVGGTWTAGTTATSTTGATLVVIRPFYQIVNAINASIPYNIAGSLAGAIASGASIAMLPMAYSGSLIQPFPQGAVGSGYVIGGIGGLGFTKPGGSGGGQ